MVMGFALCVSFAFAQTKQSKTLSVVDKSAHTFTTMENSARAEYNGSIFTKDGELFTCEFTSAEQNQGKFTTGIVGAGESVGGVNIPQHTSSSYFSQWQRIPDNNRDSIYYQTNDSTYIRFLYERYPVTWSPNSSAPGMYSRIRDYGVSETHSNGIMFMSMIDCYAPWGGNGENEEYDSWIRFQPFSTVGVPIIRARFYQFYRCFNYDKCYIDYSTNGSEWGAVEFNVKNIDVNSNGDTYGWKTVTLPYSLAGQQSVHLRIRYVDESDDHNGGYCFLIDDFSVIEGPQYGRHLVSDQKFEGFYQMMPQNLQVPVVWAAEFINDGAENLHDVNGYVYAGANNQPANLLASRHFDSIVRAYDVTRSFVIDPLGWYDSAADDHGECYYDSNYVTGPYACLPTTNTGFHYFYTDMTIQETNPLHVYGDTATFDTMHYSVNNTTVIDEQGQSHPAGVWARDLGIISRANGAWTTGIVSSGNAFSTEPDQTLWDKAGYGVFVSYVTGDSLYVDAQGNTITAIPDNWKILGVELTPSTDPDMCRPGARLRPVLWYDFINEEDGKHYFGQINTGASIHYVTEDEVIDGEDLADLRYELYGNADNPVVRMLFPNQPRLYPNLSFRVGYRLVEDHKFAVATGSNYFYVPTSDGSDSAVWYGDIPSLKNYAAASYVYNSNSVLTHDPRLDGYYCFMSPKRYPMIRMLVGPGYYVPKTTVTFQCDDPDLGVFTDGSYNPICDSIDSVAIGGGATYYILPSEGYTVDKVYRNGVEVSEDLITIEEDEDNGVVVSVFVDNIEAPVVMTCTFKLMGIYDPQAANVRMKLQPNPATSNVFISLKGVTGMVDMALIDMSGRVVNTSRFNAENGANLNVSNLAKGAYFVRITNNKFSKVEKLIVR